MRLRQSGRVLIAFTAIFFVLLAGTVQTCHICGLEGTGNGPHKLTRLGQLTDTNGICPICLSSQTASSPVAMVVPEPVYSMVEAAVAPAFSFHSHPQLFALYIRPPPSH